MKGSWDDLFAGTVSRRSFLERASLGAGIVGLLGAEAEAQQKPVLVYPPQNEKEKPAKKKAPGTQGEGDEDLVFSPENIGGGGASSAISTAVG